MNGRDEKEVLALQTSLTSLKVTDYSAIDKKDALAKSRLSEEERHERLVGHVCHT